MLSEVYVALGSNLGDSWQLLTKAIAAIRALSSTSELKVSQIYRSKPVSPMAQPDFLNAVCRFKTALAPLELLDALEQIECDLGKVAKPKEAPRCIDLDIIFFKNIEMRTDRLEIPHPRWRERLFVLRPLADIVADAAMAKSLQELLKSPFPNQEIEVVA